MNDHEHALSYALDGMKINKIVWKSPTECYILTENKIMIPVYFESLEQQIEVVGYNNK